MDLKKKHIIYVFQSPAHFEQDMIMHQTNEDVG